MAVLLQLILDDHLDLLSKLEHRLLVGLGRLRNHLLEDVTLRLIGALLLLLP
jgi:hypothetical protein